VHKLPPQQHHGQGVREKERAMQITLDKRMSYDQVTAKLGEALGCNPLCLRLTMHNPFSDLPKPQPIKFRGVESLQEMLTSFQKTPITVNVWLVSSMNIFTLYIKRKA
jgi:ubiquitin carboxyl-terminal hydrolase 7